eukprot:jgi/Psemu1/303648/fgenesh1_kg.116_\
MPTSSSARGKESLPTTTSWFSENMQETRDPAPGESHCCAQALSSTHSSSLSPPTMTSWEEQEFSSGMVPTDHCHWQPAKTKNTKILAVSKSHNSLELLDSLAQDPNWMMDEANPSKNAGLHCNDDGEDQDGDCDCENEDNNNNNGLSSWIGRGSLPKYHYMGGNYFAVQDTTANATDEMELFALERGGDY